MKIESNSYSYVDLSTKEFDELFANAKTFRKNVIIKARIAESEESIETILSGGLLETVNKTSVGSVVVTNPSGEEYIIDFEKFEKLYEKTEDDLWRAKGVIKALENPTGEKIKIMASWGSRQYGESDCIIAESQAENGDRYIIGHEEFKSTYEEL